MAKKQVQITINELVDKWDLPKAWCAKQMGISRNSFGNKIHELNKWCYFKKEEQDRFTESLNELAKDIERLK